MNEGRQSSSYFFIVEVRILLDVNVIIDGIAVVSSSDIAGVQGSGKGSNLKLHFAESWKDLTKRIIFTNARGLNPVVIILGINDLLEEDNGQLRNYGISVPKEALEFNGSILWIVEGTTADGVIYYTAREEMKVLSGMSKLFADAVASQDLTPSQAAQIQAQIDGIYIKSISEITRNNDIVTVTYTNGEADTFELKDGEDGYTPQKGVDYVDGTDGISPKVEVSEIDGGHRVTVTDADGTKFFDVMDGKDSEESGVAFEVGQALELTPDGILNVLTASEASADNTLPITSAAVNTVVGNIEILLSKI